MLRNIGDRMQLNIARQDTVALGPDLDIVDRSQEFTSAHVTDQLLALDADRERHLAVTIDYCGDSTFATCCAGGPLTDRFARRRGQNRNIGHFSLLGLAS